MLNKYEKNEIKARALSNVADSVTWQVQQAEDCLHSSERQWEENSDNSYYEKEYMRCEAELALWKEIEALLEKKLQK